MTQQKIRILSTLLLLSVLPFSAHAHTGIGSMHGFVDGFSHPWLGPDHLLAMMAIGLWAVVSGGRWLWLLPATFVAAMVVGALLSFSGLTIIAAESWVAFSVLALGLILAVNRSLPTLPATALVAAFALGHGYVHGSEIGADADAWFYALGFLSATASLHLVGVSACLTGPAMLKALRTVFAVVCTLTGAALLTGV